MSSAAPSIFDDLAFLGDDDDGGPGPTAGTENANGAAPGNDETEQGTEQGTEAEQGTEQGTEQGSIGPPDPAAFGT